MEFLEDAGKVFIKKISQWLAVFYEVSCTIDEKDRALLGANARVAVSSQEFLIVAFGDARNSFPKQWLDGPFVDVHVLDGLRKVFVLVGRCHESMDADGKIRVFLASSCDDFF